MEGNLHFLNFDYNQIKVYYLQGVNPTAQRAAVIAAVELPVYDFCKAHLMNTFGNNVSNHFM